MRVGVVGGGYWGSKHVRVLQGLAEIDQLVLVEPRADRRQALSASFPALLAFPRLTDALDEVDALVIATPPASHVTVALQAIEAGKHVLVEKPLTTSVADAERLIAAAQDADVTLMVGHTFEYNAAVERLRAAVQDGALGDVHYVDTARLNLGLYQNDVNVVWDLAPHDVSILNRVLDATPDTVQAWGRAHAHAYLEDVAYIRLEYSAIGVSAQVHVSWLDPCKVRRVTVVGSEQMAVYNDLADDARLRIYDKGVETPDSQQLHEYPVSYRHGGIVAPYIEFPEPLGVQDRHFVECARESLVPRTDGHSGLAVVEVLEAAQHSLRTGNQVVRLPARARPRQPTRLRGVGRALSA